MHFLFQRHLQLVGNRDSVFKGFGSAMFHPEIDGERFMEAAKVFMNHILANRDELFVKPYKIMFGKDLDMDWTCFLSVNAEASQLVGEKYRGRDKVCGPESPPVLGNRRHKRLPTSRTGHDHTIFAPARERLCIGSVALGHHQS